MTKGIKSEIKELVDHLNKATEAFHEAEKTGQLPPQPHPIYTVLNELQLMGFTLKELWKDDKEAIEYLEKLFEVTK
jgi:hypothetical protein